MDIYTLLRRDNAKLDRLVAQLRETAATEEEGRRALLAEVGEAFRAHERSSDPLFPYLVNDDEAEHEASLARDEHKDAKALLEALEHLSPSDARFSRSVEDLEGLLRQHFQREETQLIPRALELISELDAEVFGRQVQSEREERPSP